MVSIYLYVPNLIGYLRIVLVFLGYGLALVDYRITVVSYMLSQLLDAADGYAARVLGQSSTFGAVLDMVTDRASTTCLCVVLAHFYPSWILFLTALVMLDIFSHCAPAPPRARARTDPAPTPPRRPCATL